MSVGHASLLKHQSSLSYTFCDMCVDFIYPLSVTSDPRRARFSMTPQLPPAYLACLPTATPPERDRLHPARPSLP